MFGRTQMQVVSLNDLKEFMQGVLPAMQAPTSTTTVTIYIQELHIHQPGSGTGAAMLPGSQKGTLALPDPGVRAYPDPFERQQGQNWAKHFDGIDEVLTDLIPGARR